MCWCWITGLGFFFFLFNIFLAQKQELKYLNNTTSTSKQHNNNKNINNIISDKSKNNTNSTSTHHYTTTTTTTRRDKSPITLITLIHLSGQVTLNTNTFTTAPTPTTTDMILYLNCHSTPSFWQSIEQKNNYMYGFLLAIQLIISWYLNVYIIQCICTLSTIVFFRGSWEWEYFRPMSGRENWK